MILEFHIFKQSVRVLQGSGNETCWFGNSERNVSFQLLLNSRWAVLLLKLPWMVAVLGKL